MNNMNFFKGLVLFSSLLGVYPVHGLEPKEAVVSDYTKAIKMEQQRTAAAERHVQELEAALRERDKAAVPAATWPAGVVFQDAFKDGSGIGPEMVVIPAGHFLMGSLESEAGRDKDEGPQHEVSVKKFALGKTEVTVGEFRRFVRATSYKTEAERDVGAQGCNTLEDGKWDWHAGRYWDNTGFKQSDKQPVACISWNDAKEYVKWLSSSTGNSYRLPSEAEWEYAARAGSTTARYWGNNPDDACRYANVADQTTNGGQSWPTKHNCKDGNWFSAPVASYTANAFGLYDMIGNVWEWVEDCSHDSYSGAPVDGRVWAGGNCSVRVLRGGSWLNKPDDARSAIRNWGGASSRGGFYGFRLARMLP